MSLLLALLGTPPAVDGGIPWQVCDWLVPEDDEDEEGSWIAQVYSAAFVPTVEVFVPSSEDQDEEDDAAFEPGFQFTPPLNDYVAIQAITDADEEEEDQQAVAHVTADAVVPPLNDFVAGVAEAQDEDEDEVEPVAQFTPPLNAVITAQQAQDDDEDEDEAGWLQQVTTEIAAADDFIQSVVSEDDNLDDDDGLFDPVWNAAFDPAPAPTPPAPEPVVETTGRGGSGVPKSRYRSQHEIKQRRQEQQILAVIHSFLRMKNEE